MIKFSFEVPISYLKEFDKLNDYHFILAHLLVKDKYYAQFYKRSKKFKILDNGALELGQSIDTDTLIKLALDFRVNVLVLPDTWMDKDNTLKRSLDAVKQIVSCKLTNRFDIMFVPQGKTITEFIDCLTSFLQQTQYYNPDITQRVIIGLPYLTCAKICSFVSPMFPSRDDDVTNARIYLMQKIREFCRLRVHLLGAGENMTQEISFMRHYPNVLSVDTSTPFVLALNGVKLDEYGLFTRIIKPGLDFHMPYDKKLLKLALHNARIIKRFGGI